MTAATSIWTCYRVELQVSNAFLAQWMRQLARWMLFHGSASSLQKVTNGMTRVRLDT